MGQSLVVLQKEMHTPEMLFTRYETFEFQTSAAFVLNLSIPKTGQ